MRAKGDEPDIPWLWVSTNFLTRDKQLTGLLKGEKLDWNGRLV
jgi:hypothetical protein